MNLCVFGQCQGGNAVLWFDLFNRCTDENDFFDKIFYICRNSNSLGKQKFKIIELYGKKSKIKLLEKIKTKIISDYWFVPFFNKFFEKNKIDIIHLQGNYTPESNLKIINSNKNAKIIINIYGSDFYQLYKKSKSKIFKDQFISVLQKADYITCNWITTFNDFIKEFPEYKSKTDSIMWGVDEKWIFEEVPKKSEEETIFLSARGLYEYNNIDILVEAFCLEFKGKPSFKLKLVNGYGNSENVIDKVKQIINKYEMDAQVELRINEWISEEELMNYYKNSHFNFCIGETDQLSISIFYGILSGCQTVLSPLKNYYDFKDWGFESPVILKKINIEELQQYFRTCNFKKATIENDFNLGASKMIFYKNFFKYKELYAILKNRSDG